MTLPHLLPRAAATGLALLLASLLQAPGSDAATRAGFRVSASVTQGCLVNHAPPGNGGNLGNLGRLDFGRHPATSTARIGAQLTPNGAITLACTPGIALRKIFWRQLSLLGTTMGSPDDWAAMMSFVAQHQIKPIVSDVFPLADAAQAFDLMERGGQCGKIVVRVSD